MVSKVNIEKIVIFQNNNKYLHIAMKLWDWHDGWTW